MKVRTRRSAETVEEYLENQYEQYGGFVDCMEIHPREGTDRMDEDDIEPLHVEEV